MMLRIKGHAKVIVGFDMAINMTREQFDEYREDHQDDLIAEVLDLESEEVKTTFVEKLMIHGIKEEE